MKHIFRKYSLQLVKETSAKYEIENKISSPNDIVKVLSGVLNLEKQTEEVLVLATLNTQNVVTGLFEVSRGTINSSLVSPREIFKRAILNNASSIILAHNHPGNDSEASINDIEVTKKIAECSELLGIKLLDHVIVYEDGNNVRNTSLKKLGIIM
ncbi:radC-like JAB domain protein (plasmid) [Clostridium baratii str. Sullivan]|uniref:RadC-like JAB domain protein n=1 Tax=Clostridium baratii str. Sullivan TaxID=1415775 RepID=A0A0A7G2W7_9CLOT|nr:JAB domain-containing protein [Clostridium baratii]AIY85360.1 radC-like JAB domain protein [Clostridium baratii str. Sullivan]